MQDSVSRFSLKFVDRATESLYTRHSDRNRVFFAKYIYSFLIVALVAIFVLNCTTKRDANISLRIFIHLAAVSLLLVFSRLFPKTTGYHGYIHMTVYFAIHSILPEATYTTTLRTLTTGIGL